MIPTPYFTKQHSKLAGICFIMAALSSIIGLALYDPILNGSEFLVSANQHYNRIVLGAVHELILAASATGTGILFFPLLKQYSSALGIGYLSFRLLEVVFIMMGLLGVLTALSVSLLYTQGAIPQADDARYLMLCLKAFHKWTFILGPNFMLAINTFMYSYVFLQTKWIPITLSKTGLIAAVLIMTAAMLELFGVIEQISVWGILLALPIASYEMILAGWLIRKGVNTGNQR